MNMNLKSDAVVKKDRLRFTKNKMSANLTYLAILFNAFYFVNIYTSDIHYEVGSFYYKAIMGISVVYNLLFMLICFLSSEEVKNYKMSFAFVLIAVGIGQIVRIFILPSQAIDPNGTIRPDGKPIMDEQQFFWVCLFLVVSAAFCVIAGVIGIIKTRTLTSYQAELNKKGSAS